MVQFVFTPWRNRAELLHVRQQLFPASSFFTNNPGTGASHSTPPTSSSTSAPPEPWWASPTELHEIERAIARIFMWVHRGGCPHVVESTALLMAAIVFDARGSHDAMAQAAVVGGYLVGFTRYVFLLLRSALGETALATSAPLLTQNSFVTGLLDSHQDKARKLSMYGVAKTIGLPASFVELRHQGTHEPMPSLTQLRPAARRALVWIWEYYWRNLPEENEGVGGEDATARVMVMGETTKDVKSGRRRGKETITAGGGGAAAHNSLEARMCRSALLGYLQRHEGEVGEAATEGLMRQLRKWDSFLVLTTLTDIGESTRDSGMLLRSVKLARALLGTTELLEGQQQEEEGDGAVLRQELVMARGEATRVGEGSQRSIWGKVTGKRKKNEDEDGEHDRKRGSWYKQQGPWVAKPIGVL